PRIQICQPDRFKTQRLTLARPDRSRKSLHASRRIVKHFLRRQRTVCYFSFGSVSPGSTHVTLISLGLFASSSFSSSISRTNSPTDTFLSLTFASNASMARLISCALLARLFGGLLAPFFA